MLLRDSGLCGVKTRPISGASMSFHLSSVSIALLAGTLAVDVSATIREGQGRQGAPIPGQPDVIFVDEVGPPSTMRAMYDRCALVVHGVVEVVGSPMRRPDSDMPVAVRHQTIRVLEVLKAENERPTPARIQVMQVGGTIDVGGRETATNYVVPLFRVGDELVLFLMKGRNQAVYSIAYGEGGVFNINTADSSAHVPENISRTMPEFANRKVIPSTELLSSLRSLRDKR